MHANVEFAQKVALAYGAVCKPLCRELGLDRVIAIGPKAASIARTAGEAAEHFDTIADALPALRAAFVPGAAALVKASHAMEFGKIVKELETL